MWTRSDLKKKSKSFLKINLGVAILVCLFYAFVSGVFGNQTYLETANDTAQTKYNEAVNSGNFDDYNEFLEDNSFTDADGKMPYYFHLYKSGISIEDYKDIVGVDTPIPESEALNLLLGGGYKVYLTPVAVGIISIISVLCSVFILNPITIGYKRYFLKGNRDLNEKPSFSNLFSTFKDGTWNSVGVKLLVKNIYLMLWSLLFIIPGIYKYYQYFYVDYILADNPELSISEAIAISKIMTHQDKFNIFILGLSFIGWVFLSSLLLGLGFIILNPYVEATYANLYIKVKSDKAETFEQLKSMVQ